MILLNMCCRRKRVEKESEKVLYCTCMRTKQERQNIIIFYRKDGTGFNVVRADLLHRKQS